jgi:hypothetical protein
MRGEPRSRASVFRDSGALGSDPLHVIPQGYCAGVASLSTTREYRSRRARMTIILTISVRPGKTRTHLGTWRRIDWRRTKTILRGQDLLATRVAVRRRKPLRASTCGVAESWVVRVFPAVAIGRLVSAAHDVPGLIASCAHTCHRCHARGP